MLRGFRMNAREMKRKAHKYDEKEANAAQLKKQYLVYKAERSGQERQTKKRKEQRENR